MTNVSASTIIGVSTPTRAPHRLGRAVTSLRLSAALGLGSWMGCDAGAFLCDRDDDCTTDDSVGVCQPIGHCSFADDECVSGQRYGELSGRMAGLCVEVAGSDDSSDSSSGPYPDVDLEENGTTGEDDPTSEESSSDGSLQEDDTHVSCRLDDFDDRVLDSSWCTNTPPGIVVSEDQGVLRFDMSPEEWEGGEQFGDIHSCADLPLLELVATAKIEQVPAVSRHTEGFLELGNQAFAFGLGVTEDHIYAYEFVDGHYSYAAEQRYEPEQQQVWRLRGTGEGVVAEVSPNGQDWTLVHVFAVDLAGELGVGSVGVWSKEAPPSPVAGEIGWFELCSRQ